MRDNESLTSSWQVPLIVVLGIVLVVVAAILLTQIDGIQRRSVLPPKRLPVIDQEATAAAGEPGIIYLPSKARITVTAPITISSTPLETPTAATVSELIPTCSALPEGWTDYIVKLGDSLASLAIKFDVNKKTIIQANCLAYEQIIQGQLIYLPQNVPTKNNETECGAPQDWIHTVVHPGDTVLKLAEEHQSTVYLIMNANCLENTYLVVGRKLFLPSSQPPSSTATAPIHLPAQPSLTATIGPNRS